MENVLAFDIGGSKISYAVINKEGNFSTSITKIITPSNKSDIAAIVQSAADKYKPEGLAVATAGVVYNNKLCGKPNNLPAGYEDIDFSKLSGLPCLLENDANAATWAEYKSGSLQNYRHCALLTLGTDVGCGLILDGALYYGKCGAAGEVTFAASGRQLAKLAKHAGLDESDCFVLYELAQKGHEAAQQIYLKWLKNLQQSLILLNQILDVEAIALSGSLAKIVDYKSLNAELKKTFRHNTPLVMPALAENNAGLIGAALLFFEQHK